MILDKRMTTAKGLVVKLSNMAMLALEKSLIALFEGDYSAKMETDQLKSDAIRAEKEALEYCMQTAALVHPEAHDLRFLMMSVRIVKDFERIVSLAANIAESGVSISDKTSVNCLSKISRIGNLAREMLENTTTAFIRENQALCSTVFSQDVVTDNLRDSVLADLVSSKQKNQGNAEDLFHLIRITRSLERIGDVCVGIAEAAIFIIDGKLILHEITF